MISNVIFKILIKIFSKIWPNFDQNHWYHDQNIWKIWPLRKKIPEYFRNLNEIFVIFHQKFYKFDKKIGIMTKILENCDKNIRYTGEKKYLSKKSRKFYSKFWKFCSKWPGFYSKCQLWSNIEHYKPKVLSKIRILLGWIFDEMSKVCVKISNSIRYRSNALWKMIKIFKKMENIYEIPR